MSVDSLWARLEEQLVPVFADYRSRIDELPVAIKADRTLLTEADMAVQDLIVTAIRAREPDAVIIAEEDGRTEPRSEVSESRGRVWVIDPIDGTAEFVRKERVEYCSVVCLLDDWEPAEAFVLAPELGAGRTALVATASASRGIVQLGDREMRRAVPADRTRWLSITRSASDPPRRFEATAADQGFHSKTSTTSQTLDMLRTVLDISSLTDPPLPQFSLFWRRYQKLWDGVAGLCMASAADLRTCDEYGHSLPRGPQFLSDPTPTFSSTVVGQPEIVTWFLDVVTT